MHAPIRSATATVTLLLLAAAPALPDPCSRSFEPLRDELEGRRALVAFPSDPAEKAERKALDSVLRRLRKRSTSLAKDAGTARAAGEALVGRYPGDPRIEFLVDDLLDRLRADLALERDDLARTADQFPAGEERDRARAGVDEIDEALALVDGAADADLPVRTDGLATAARAAESAYRAVLEGADRKRKRPCGELLSVREGGVLLWRADTLEVLHHGPSASFRITARRRRLPVDDSELQLEIRDFHGAGNYPFEFGTGLWRDGSFTYHGVVASGSLVVDRYDPTEGIAEGTFAFTARGCLFDCSATEVTGGVFSTRRVRRL